MSKNIFSILYISDSEEDEEKSINIINPPKQKPKKVYLCNMFKKKIIKRKYCKNVNNNNNVLDNIIITKNEKLINNIIEPKKYDKIFFIGHKNKIIDIVQYPMYKKIIKIKK